MPSTTLTVTAVNDSDVESCDWIGVSATFGEGPTVIPPAQVILVMDQHEESRGAITSLTVGLSGIQTGRLTASDGGGDWYSMEAVGGKSYLIEVKHPMAFSAIDENGVGGNPMQVSGYLVDPSILEVVDESDDHVLGEHDQGGFTLNFARAFFNPEDDGTYHIEVVAGPKDRRALGCYTISLRVDDHADDYRTDPSVIVTPGESITGTIDSDVAPDDPGLNFWDWKIDPPCARAVRLTT